MKRLFLVFSFVCSALVIENSIAIADDRVQFCVVFPDGHVGPCAESLQNCDVNNSNKHMGATCVPMPKK